MKRRKRQPSALVPVIVAVLLLLSDPMPALSSDDRVGGGRMLAPPSSDEFESIFNQALAEFDEAQQLPPGRSDRARRLFRAAAERFQGLIAAGVVNGRLEYDLGNCYLQAGDVGLAILHYRRAQRLIPGDPLLEDNLKTAQDRCLLSIRPSRANAFVRSVFFWHFQTGINSRIRVALGAFLGVWALLVLRNFVRRHWVSGTALACLTLSLACGVSAGLTHWSERNAPGGVVIAMDVAVYKGPGAGYQRQFEQPLQPGTEFTLKQRRKGWWEIQLRDGKTGWIEANQADRVPPAAAG